MAKGLQRKELLKFQARHLYLTTDKTLDEIGAKFKVCRQTIAAWIADVREQIDEVAIMEAARKDLIDLTSDSIRYYSRAVKQKRLNMVGLVAATNTLKKQKLLAEESPTTNINVKVIMEKRLAAMEAGANAFGLTINRLVPTNGESPADPSAN